MINLQYSVAFISSCCALHRLRRSIRFPSIFGFLMIFCCKTQRTNAKSGRPKVADWKVAMWKKFTGRLVSKWERTGRNWSNFAHTQVTVTVFKTSRHSKLLFFVKKQRTMERKKLSKGRGWESCCVKKIYGTFGVEMRAYGQKLVKFCKHTDRHTRLN